MVISFQMVHIFASETDYFPPIKALFELVTSVTLSIFQQGMEELQLLLGTLSLKCIKDGAACCLSLFGLHDRHTRWNQGDGSALSRLGLRFLERYLWITS